MRGWEAEVKALNRNHFHTQLPGPKCYFAVHDPEASRFQILQEDLSAHKAGVPVEGLSDNLLDAAISIVEGAATMHAQFLNKTHDKKRAEFASQYTGAFYEETFPKMHKDAWANVGGDLPEDIKEFGDALCAEEGLHPANLLSNLSKENGEFLSQTLVHGQYSIDNMVFDYAEDGKKKTEDGPGWYVTSC